MIALPKHNPCCLDGCGELDWVTMTAVCAKRRVFGGKIAVDHPGCGATFALCPRCGLRMVMNGGACMACNPSAGGGR